MEAGEYGLTRGTCFVARRLEVVAVAGLLWISWCALGRAGFIFNFVDPEQSVSTRWRGNDSRPKSAHREVTDPHQVYHFLRSHLRTMPSIDQYE